MPVLNRPAPHQRAGIKTARRILCLLTLFLAPFTTAQDEPGADAIALLDRAEELIAHEDATGRSAAALLGVLSETDLELLKAAISEAAELTDAATIAIDEAVKAIDASPDADVGQDERRFRLAVERREMRLPLARARAAVILAALQRDERTRTALATTALNALHKVTLRGAAIDVRGSVIAGEAMLLIGQDAKALSSFENAIQRAESATGDDAPAPMDLAEARLGRALAIAGAESDHAARIALTDSARRPPFVTEGDDRSSPLLTLLRADAAARIDLRSGETPVSIAGYLDAMEGAGTEAERVALREAVIGRLNRLWTLDAWSNADAPPMAQVARAIRQADDKSTRSTAVRALERLLDDPGALGEVELAEARLALAKIDSRDNPRRAMRLLLEIADDADSPLAPTALREAYAVGLDHEHNDMADQVSALFDRTIATMIRRAENDAQSEAIWLRRAAFFEAVGDTRKAIEAYERIGSDSETARRARSRSISLRAGELIRSPDTERASALLARIEEASGDPIGDETREVMAGARVLALVELGRLEQAVEAIEELPPSPPGAGALAELAISQCLTPLRARILDAEARADESAREAAARLLLRTVRSPRAAAGEPSHDLREALGFALLHSGDPESADSVYRRLIEERFDHRLNVWRAEAFHAMDRPVAAFPLYRSVMQRLEASGETGDPDYWRCWAGMLEILAAREGEERDVEALIVQINRLRLIDPALGGEPHRSRIEAVERALAPTGE